MKARKLHGRELREARARLRAEAVASSASRNAEVPRGREVKVPEVTAYALPGHGKCRGTGMLTASVACPCSTKRFLRAHPEVIIIPDGDRTSVYWPATISVEEDPE